MVAPLTSAARPASVGALLAQWRRERRWSQLDLAQRAEVSPRHLCFVETGRAKPSRDMVLRLAAALDVPLRERNTLLLAAGFAPAFDESPLDAPALASVRTALDAILRQQEPFPAVVMNRRWDVITGNDAAKGFFAYLLDWPVRPANVNLVRLVFDPAGLRPRIANWRAVAAAIFHRIRRESVGGMVDATVQQLIDDVLAFPEVAAAVRDVQLDKPSIPVIPISYTKGGGEPVFDYFSTVTTLGTPQDVTLQELRIECFYPVDATTERHARALRTQR
jgi:transcriptional regulator with XRE-family HTH domain